MHLADYFSRTVDDLRDRSLGPAEEYSMLRASGLIRQMLMDREPLAPRVAKRLGMPLRFEVADFDASRIYESARIPPSATWANPSPIGESGVAVDLPGFLAHKVATIASESFTVRDVVRAVAHVHGGVHYFSPENDREQRLVDYDRRRNVRELGILHASVQSIGQITVAALEPLAIAGRARPDLLELE